MSRSNKRCLVCCLKNLTFNQYYKQAVVTMPTSTLTQEAGGTKLMLPEELNEKDIAMIKNMHSAGAVAKYEITISIAKVIVCASDRTLLKENGSYIDLTAS